MYDIQDGTVMLTSKRDISYNSDKPTVCVYLEKDTVSKLRSMGFKYSSSQWFDRPYLMLRVPAPYYCISLSARSDKWGVVGEICVDTPHINHRGGYNHMLKAVYSTESDDGDCLKVTEDLLIKLRDLYTDHHNKLITNLNNLIEGKYEK